jgi:2-oxoisovalerate dehydrogenase E2 component (dihydrolipoyl transacylase)
MEDRAIVLSLWLVPPGSRVEAGDPLVEVLAGPATVDLPAPTDGVLLRTLAAEDEPLHVGQRLAVIRSDP